MRLTLLHLLLSDEKKRLIIVHFDQMVHGPMLNGALSIMEK